nr:glycine-rich protein 1-like [Aegilops tauschii subsp. strangulata]
MGTPWGSGDGDGGNLIWWIGTPAGAVDAGLELTGGGCCSAAPGSGNGGAPGAAEAARSGGCHCSQGGAMVAVDVSCSGPANAAEAAWCGGCHSSHSGAMAAMGGVAGCGP